MKLHARGAAGHGSMPQPDSAILKLARALARIGNQPLPAHVVPAARRMLRELGKARGLSAQAVMALLAQAPLTDLVLENAIADPKLRRSLASLLHNTVVPTGLRAGQAPNVIPSMAEAVLDGRILPGHTTADLLRELTELVDDRDLEVEVFKKIAPVEAPVDTPLYRQLERAIWQMDPKGVPFPSMTPGFTDASAFSKLGTRFYGFTPVVLPEAAGVAFSDRYHGHDERIPVQGFARGLEALWSAVAAFRGKSG
jgi:acetylornithine deacetylase/succinyl-diaminopimelate desuccinylase-like protein